MLEKFKKSLRINQTDAESHLWYHLRGRRFRGWKFRRQHILEGYIVDFICFERRLIIELDGEQHAQQKSYDLHRTDILEQQGFKVLRFWNNEVFDNLEAVLEIILTTPHPQQTATSPARGEVKRALRFPHGWPSACSDFIGVCLI